MHDSFELLSLNDCYLSEYLAPKIKLSIQPDKSIVIIRCYSEEDDTHHPSQKYLILKLSIQLIS